MKILFLYTEVAGYFLACAETLHQISGAEIHVVRWPINAEAPFAFRDYAGVTFHERKDHTSQTLIELYQQLQPSIVCVTGWVDKAYLDTAAHIRKQGVPVVCLLDNQWRGDLRQKIATIVSPWMLQRRFSHVWVPGLYQYEFARRLGFARDHILTGVYSAATSPFAAVAEARPAARPHHLVYVGRFVEVKGVRELVAAFTQTLADGHDWHLSLVGAGPLKAEFQPSERISVQDFVQPEQLPALAAQAGAFVLPSHFEPWGVVLHEFSAAGLPVVASDACGAATAFLRNGYNGFQFKSGNETALYHALQALFRTPDEQLSQMGQRSYELSRSISPEIWAHTLLSILPRA